MTSYQVNPESPAQGTIWRQWMIAILVNITLFGYGMQMGWVACATKALLSEESPAGVAFSSYELSWLASSPCLAAMASIPVYTYLVDRIGRKFCIAGCAFLQLISWILKLSFITFPGLMIARILGGIASGGCIYIMPMYLKEISRDDVRGTLGMVLNVERYLGLFAMFVMGVFMSYHAVLWTAIGIALINVVTILLAPESPTYYVKIGNMDAAASTIAYLRGLAVEDKAVKNAIDDLRAEDDKFKSISNVTFIGIFKQKAWCKGFIFMTLLILCHGLNGVYSAVNYVPTILEQSGVHVNPELQSLSIPVFMIIGAMLSIALIEKLGRKILLTVSFLLAMISFSTLAAAIMIQNCGGVVPSWITVLVLVVPMCTYAAAIAPIPFIIMAEMFNFQIRAKVMGCLGMLGWLGAFTQTLIFVPITNAFGAHVAFIGAALVNLCGTAVLLVLIPETRAKSVEQIERELEKRLERKLK